MPWVIKDYSNADVNLNDLNEKNLRDLSLPMGMMEINESSTIRKKHFIEILKLKKKKTKKYGMII